MKFSAVFAIVLILYIQATAQSTFFKGGFGYGLPSGDRLGFSEPNNAQKNVYGSYGKGFTVGLNIGHMANENIGLDLGIWYVTGSTYKFIDDFGPAVGYSTHLLSGKTTRIMPALKITSGNNTKPYVKFGVLLGIATTLNDDETFSMASGGSEFVNHQWTGGSSFGWTGAFGIDFSENQTASVFVELNFCYQLFDPDLETVTIAGQDSQKFHLVDEPSSAAGDEKLKLSFPFSTIGLTAGVKFSSLTKKKHGADNPVK